MSQTTKAVRVGNVTIGGGAPVSIQSMTNTKTTDIPATIAQIYRLQEAGCHIVRLAVPNIAAVQAFAEIKKQASVPLVADIHFDYRLALSSMDAGADKIRINPGNIGGKDKLHEVVKKAVAYKIPIRVGVNSGSIEKDILEEEGGPSVKALVRSALRNIEACREFGAEDLVLSLKSSDVMNTVKAYREASRQTDVPLHIGVTEAGTVKTGTIRSAVALGILLSEGIGDTMRVSLTGDPVEEVVAGYQILKSLGLSSKGVTLISCPTCGRTEIDLISIANEVEQRLSSIDKPITVAVMGCPVNGPGEAKHADIGIACGKKGATLFKKGQVIRKIPEDKIVDELLSEIVSWQNSDQENKVHPPNAVLLAKKSEKHS